jgi:hypothetical protein
MVSDGAGRSGANAIGRKLSQALDQADFPQEKIRASAPPAFVAAFYAR